MKKLVIIPAYNEEHSIGRVIQEVRRKTKDFDVVVVNDCSKDRTAEICREYGATVLDLAVNLGIGGAMQTGYRYADENGYGCAVQVDGDGQHDPAYLDSMFELLCSEKADMVIGSRFIERQGYQSSVLRRNGIRYFSWLIRVLTKQTVTDPTSGMRMVNREQIERFAEEYPSDYPEPESLVHLLKREKKVIEAPVIMRERAEGRSSIRLKGSVYYMIKVTIAIILERMRKS